MEKGSLVTSRSGPAPKRFRFGLFEIDSLSGELRKNGLRIRIQEQPFQILLLLVSRPGEVVSREELRQQIWSNDTFVDFDHGLNTAIRKLRDALGDDANNPRFVQTLARRGYRFIAPVQPECSEAGAAPGNSEVMAVESSSLEEGHSRLPSTPALSAVQVEERQTELNRVQTAPGTPEKGEAGIAGDNLPHPSPGLTRTLFGLAQVLYLTFYVVALTRLEIIRPIVDRWRSGWGAPVMVVALLTAGIGIVVRLYLLSAVAFDYKKLGRAFRRIFPLVLPLDMLWALAPFLLLPHIAIGAAFAACAALLYLPFSQRTLIRMTYSEY